MVSSPMKFPSEVNIDYPCIGIYLEWKASKVHIEIQIFGILKIELQIMID